MKILWCITGAGEFLKESIEMMMKLSEKNEITVFMSKSGEEVLRSYKLFREIKKNWPIERDNDESSMAAGKVSLGHYDALVVSPATANTVAKVANGIADTLVTTAVSLALKTDVKIYMLPTDWKISRVKIPTTLVTKGVRVHMKPRKADLRNIKYLEDEGIVVLESPKKLLEELI